MKEAIVSFKTAKLLSEAGFNIKTAYFYTKHHNVKLFGVDEHSRYYQVKNKVGKIYRVGEYAVLKEENIYYAPTQCFAQKWIREKYKMHIEILLEEENPYKNYYYRVMKLGKYFSLAHSKTFKTYEQALEAGLQEVIRYIIKN